MNWLLRIVGKRPAAAHPEHAVVTQKLNEQERRLQELENIRTSARAIAGRLNER